MPLVAHALVTLDDTKTFLGITDNSKDAILTMMINMATDYIESQTGRRFVSTAHADEEFDGTGTQQLPLKAYPVLTFTQLQVNNSSNNVESWSTIDATNYWVDETTGIITKTDSFTDFVDTNDEEALSDTPFQRGKNRYRATYTSGYSIIPYDLQFACMSIVGQLFNTKSGAGIKSESLGDHSVTYQDITEVNGGMRGGILEDVLSKYREIPMAS